MFSVPWSALGKISGYFPSCLSNFLYHPIPCWTSLYPSTSANPLILPWPFSTPFRLYLSATSPMTSSSPLSTTHSYVAIPTPMCICLAQWFMHYGCNSFTLLKPASVIQCQGFTYVYAMKMLRYCGPTIHTHRDHWSVISYKYCMWLVNYWSE